MVRIGTLPTRLLALDYGADLVYSEVRPIYRSSLLTYESCGGYCTACEWGVEVLTEKWAFVKIDIYIQKGLVERKSSTPQLLF